MSCAWFRLMAVSIMDNITLFQFSFFSIYAVWLIQAMLGKLNLLAAQLLQKLYITACLKIPEPQFCWEVYYLVKLW